MAHQLFFDGFEDCASYADLNLYGYSPTADSWGDQLVSVLATGGRRGGKCVKIATAYDGGLKFSIAASSHVVLGVALRMNQTGFFSGPMVVRLLGGGQVHAQVALQESQVMTLYAGGAQVAQSTQTLPRDAWIFLELGLFVANAGGSYELRVNGSSQGYVPANTGDTQTGATPAVDAIHIVGLGGGGVQHQIYVDDLYVNYGDELVWLGDSRVDRLPLTADATPQDWTPSSGNAWERLNAGDGYIASSVDEATALFTAAPLAHEPDTIHGVCARSVLVKDSAGARAVAAVLKRGDAEAESSPLTLAQTNAALTQIRQTDPATSAAWTLSAVNALRAGFRVKL